MPKIPIYVINLDRSTDRWKNISGQVAQLKEKAQVRRWRAIDGNSEEIEKYFQHVDQKKATAIKGRPLSNGQIGCFASHYHVWKSIAETGTSAIVLEDDAQIQLKDFENLVDTISEFPNTVECLRLFKNETKRARVLAQGEAAGIKYARFSKAHIGTPGYFLNTTGASKFLSYFHTWVLPVDLSMGLFWKHKVDCYGLIKPCVSHGKFITTGTGENRPTLTVGARIRKEVNAATMRINRSVYNAKF